MNRKQQLKSIKSKKEFDIIVIGGGATGLGIAVDAASRGYSVALFESHDFSKGTSSRSTKLVHGGVRYLAQGDVGLVFEALKERGLLANNASHLVRTQPFVIPNYSTLDSYWYATGLRVYDWMARSLSLGKTKSLTKKETIEKLPTLSTKNLKSGVVYYDGQFDDSRLSINLAQTAIEQGAHLVNYCKVTDFLKGKEKQKIKGVSVKNCISGKSFDIKSKVVVNATGVFIDHLLKKDNPSAKKSIIPSQGIHLVVDQKFMPSDHALMIPKTSDGRVLFAVPWHDKLIIGTTDTLIKSPEYEPKPLDQEVQFILNNVNEYLEKNISRKDVLSVYSGLRPLAAPDDESKGTKEISRSHKVLVSDSGLITISGGKWTTYRKIAEDVVDKAIRIHKLRDAECITEQLAIHGNISQKSKKAHALHYYGSDLEQVKDLMKDKSLAKKIHPDYPYVMAQVIWSIRHEMAMNLEDVLARRIRLLFLDAKAACDAAANVADLMALEMGKDDDWVSDQVKSFKKLSKQYLLKS